MFFNPNSSIMGSDNCGFISSVLKLHKLFVLLKSVLAETLYLITPPPHPLPFLPLPIYFPFCNFK